MLKTCLKGRNENNADNFIKPSFPSILTTNDLIKNTSKPSDSNGIKIFPSAFIAYRKRTSH